jgi:hypothetical protein|tara:strand:+ start:238 stop:444 length:207 start_codon:yes stop_codon:yes gene_type:complete
VKLDYYICRVTKCVPESINFFEDEEEYVYALPYKDIMKEVKRHYREGADAVELEMITKEEYERLSKPY